MPALRKNKGKKRTTRGNKKSKSKSQKIVNRKSSLDYSTPESVNKSKPANKKRKTRDINLNINIEEKEKDSDYGRKNKGKALKKGNNNSKKVNNKKKNVDSNDNDNAKSKDEINKGKQNAYENGQKNGKKNTKNNSKNVNGKGNDNAKGNDITDEKNDISDEPSESNDEMEDNNKYFGYEYDRLIGMAKQGKNKYRKTRILTYVKDNGFEPYLTYALVQQVKTEIDTHTKENYKYLHQRFIISTDAAQYMLFGPKGAAIKKKLKKKNGPIINKNHLYWCKGLKMYSCDGSSKPYWLDPSGPEELWKAEMDTLPKTFTKVCSYV